MSKTSQDLSHIEAVIFDVDGVLSHQTIELDDNGTPLRTANVRDGYAINQAARHGLALGIISGGASDIVPKRFAPLGVQFIRMQVKNKYECLQEFIQTTGIPVERIIYCGDDIPDMEVMRTVGFAVAPKDAATEVRAIADYISPVNGGDGVARDILEEVLKSKYGAEWWKDSRSIR